MRIFLFFFFQAEDGIRDLYVTGVQTCALPIFALRQPADVRRLLVGEADVGRLTQRELMSFRSGSVGTLLQGAARNLLPYGRSEERRVGKECRGRCGPKQ